MRQILYDLSTVWPSMKNLYKAMGFVLKAIFDRRIVWEEKFEGDNGLQRFWDNFIEDWCYRIISLIVVSLMFWGMIHSPWVVSSPQWIGN